MGPILEERLNIVGFPREKQALLISAVRGREACELFILLTIFLCYRRSRQQAYQSGRLAYLLLISRADPPQPASAGSPTVGVQTDPGGFIVA
jgi:hypothetical protein